MLHVLFHIVKSKLEAYLIISEQDSTAYVWVTVWYHLLFKKLPALPTLWIHPWLSVLPSPLWSLADTASRTECDTWLGNLRIPWRKEKSGWGTSSDLFHYVDIGVGGERVKKVENFFSFLNLWTAKLVNNDIFLWSNSIWDSIFSFNLNSISGYLSTCSRRDINLVRRFPYHARHRQVSHKQSRLGQARGGEDKISYLPI